MTSPIGSVAVEVLPATRNFWTKFKADTRSEAEKLGQDIGQQVSRPIASKVGASVTEGLVDAGRSAGREGSKTGEDFGAAFSKTVKARVEAALKGLPDAKIGADASELDKKVAAVRAELASLKDKKIGLDISSDEAIARVADLNKRIAALGREIEKTKAKGGDVPLNVDTVKSVGELNGLKRELTSLQREAEKPLKIKIPKVDVPKVEVPVETKLDEGSFNRNVKARLAAALKALPEAQIGVAKDQVEQDLKDIRARIATLSGKTVGVDIDEAGFFAEAQAIQSELDRLGSESVSVRVKTDAAAASVEMAKVSAEADKLGAKSPTINVDVDSAGAVAGLAAVDAASNVSMSGMQGLISAGIALGPAIVPAAAAAAAALAAIGGAALAGIAGIGVLGIALHGIVDAVKAMGEAETESAASGAKASAAQVAQQARVASATDGVKSAEAALVNARASAADAAARSAQAVVTAQAGVRDAIRGVASAQAGVRVAEKALADAQVQARVAQLGLTQARIDARRALQDLNAETRRGALDQRQALLDVQKARQDLNKTLSDPRATQIEREQARLSYDQAVQRVEDIRVRNQRLAQDKARADKAGVAGSTQVAAAQDRIKSANQRVAQAQDGVVAANNRVAQANQRVATAQAGVAAAVRAQTAQQRQSAFSVEQAQQRVISAQRSLAVAMQQTSVTGSAAANKLQKAMAALSPAGQAFARFLYSLKPIFDQLKAAAQNGLFPGLTAGIRAMLPLVPSFTRFVGSLAATLGGLFAQAGRAFGSPVWRSFFDYLSRTAGPTLQVMARVILGFAQVFATLLVAFEPVQRQIGAGLVALTKQFGDFVAKLVKSQGFADFIAYVTRNGPIIARFFIDLTTIVIKLAIALAPLGEVIVRVLGALASHLAKLNPAVLIGVAAGISAILAVVTGGTYAIVAAVVAAIALIALGFVHAWKKSEEFRDHVKAAFDSVKLTVQSVVSTVQGILQSWGITAKSLGDTVLRVFRFVGLAMDAEGRGIQLVWYSIIKPALEGFNQAVLKLWHGALEPFVNFVRSSIPNLGGIFRQSLGSVTALLQSTAGGQQLAADRVRQAEQNLAAAMRDSRTAQLGLTQARRDAKQALDELQSRVTNGALNERQAILSVKQAKQELDRVKKDPTADSLQRQQAQLTYDQAVQALKDTRAENAKTKAEKAEADKKGVEGSDQVKEAQKRVAESSKGVNTAESDLAVKRAERAESQKKQASGLAGFLQTIYNNVIKPVWNGIGGVISGTWGIISGAYNNIKTGATEVGSAFKGLKDEVVKDLTGTGGMSESAGKAKTFFSNAFTTMKIGALGFAGVMRGVVLIVQGQIGALSVLLRGLAASFAGSIGLMTIGLRFLAGSFRTQLGIAKAIVMGFVKLAGAEFGIMIEGFKGVGRGVKWVWDHVIHPAISAVATGITSTLPDAFSRGVDAVKKAFDRIQGIVKNPVKAVVQIVNVVISGYNVLADTFHAPKATKIATPRGWARGGPVPTNAGTPGKDSVPALLMPGEHVLTRQDVSAMGGQAGVYAMRHKLHHFEDGGAVGQIGGWVAAAKRNIAGLKPKFLDKTQEVVDSLLLPGEKAAANIGRQSDFAKVPAGAAQNIFAGIREKLTGIAAANSFVGNLVPFGGFNAEQMKNAGIILSVGKQLGFGSQGWVVAIATALQESGLRNLGNLGSANDHDSLGLFQQRPSMGWGSPAQIMDPAHSSAQFYKHLRGIKGWDKLPVTLAAQAVQRSAFPNAYAKWEDEARQIVGVLTGTLGSGAGGGGAWNGKIAPGIIGEMQKWALAQRGKVYEFGAVGPGTYDCCMPGRTLVYGPDGPKRMDEIQAGDKVWSRSDSGELTEQKVVKAWYTKDQMTYRVHLSGRNVDASANHPFLRVVRVPGVYRKWETEWVRLDELKRDDHVIVMDETPDAGTPAPMLAHGTPVTPDVAWLMGVIVGDGTVTNDQSAIRVCVYGDLRERAYKVFTDTWGPGKCTKGEAFGFIYSIKGAAQELWDSGLHRRGSDKRVPECVWSWPRALQLAFVDGFADADGSFSERDGMAYCSSSRTLLDEVRSILQCAGRQVSNVRTTKRDKPMVIKGKLVKDAKPLHQFVASGNGRESYAKLECDKPWVAKLFTGGEFGIRRVLDVEELSIEPTYDINVTEDHNFIADGVVVHNSGLVGDLMAIAEHKKLYRRYFLANVPSVQADTNLEPGAGKNFTVYIGGHVGDGHTAANIAGLHAEAYGGNGVPLAIGHVGTPLSYYSSSWHLPQLEGAAMAKTAGFGAGMAKGGAAVLNADARTRMDSFLKFGWPEPPQLYDTGGWLKPGGVATNRSGKPEAVFTGNQFGQLVAALQGIARTLPQLKGIATIVKQAGKKVGTAKTARIAGPPTARLLQLSNARGGVVSRLGAARSNLAGLQSAAATTRQDVIDKLRGSFNVSDVEAGASVTSSVEQLHKAVAVAEAFATNIGSLRRRGLDAGLIQQLIAAGPGETGGAAASLVKATQGELAQLNTFSKRLGNVAIDTGNSVANTLYGAGIKAAQGLVVGLAQQQKAIEGQMVRIAKGMVGAIKKALGIHSPSRVMAEVGGWTVQGVEQGIAGRLPALRLAVGDVASTLAFAGSDGYATPGLSLAGSGTGRPDLGVIGSQWDALKASGGMGGDMTLRVVVDDGAVRGLVRVEVDEAHGALADAHVYGTAN